MIGLKSKEPRLRDWNPFRQVVQWGVDLLEIKRTSITRLKLKCKEKRTYRIKPRKLEIKRTSITRLKHSTHLTYRFRRTFLFLKSKEPRLRDWNYSVVPAAPIITPILEIKRTSITRLKQYYNSPSVQRRLNLKSKEPRLRDWNEQIRLAVSAVHTFTWNQKNLDYEIETSCVFGIV